MEDGYSVVNDLSGRRNLMLYWRVRIICICNDLSMVPRHLNLKKSDQFSNGFIELYCIRLDQLNRAHYTIFASYLLTDGLRPLKNCF